MEATGAPAAVSAWDVHFQPSVPIEVLRTPCYCRRVGNDGRSICGCTPLPAWPDDLVLPEGLAQLPWWGGYGRFSIGVQEECPSGDFTKQVLGDRAQCIFPPGTALEAFFSARS
jgi:hypothetical protein